MNMVEPRNFTGLRGVLTLNLDANGPDEAEQFATDSRDDVRLGFAARREASVTIMKTELGLPGNRFDGLAQVALSLTKRQPAARPMLIRPGRFEEDAPQMGVAGLGDVTAPSARTTGVLAGNDTTVAHQLAGMIEARRWADFGHDGRRRDAGDTAPGLHPVDEVAHPRGRPRDGGVDGPLEPTDVLGRVIDLSQVIEPGGLLGGLLERERPEPLPKPLRPRPDRGGRPAAVAEQELLQPMADPQLVTLGCLPRPHEIAQGLVGGGRNPHRSEIATPEAARELFGVASVGLDPIARLHGHAHWGDDHAGDAELAELPIQGVAARAGFVADTQRVEWRQLADQFPHGVHLMGNGAERANLAVGLCDGGGDRGSMDVETDESCTLSWRPAPFACSSALRVGDPQPRVIYGLRL